MKELLKDLLVVVIALAIFVGGFYLGSHPAVIASAATEVGLGDLYTQVAPSLGLTSTQTSALQTDTVTNAAGFAPPGAGFEISEDQTVELVAAASAAAEVSAPGVVMAAATATITVPVTAKIAAVAVATGDSVAAGDPLFSLDTAALEDAVTEALAAVQAAGEGEKAAEAQANLEQAAQNLANAQILSPVDGKVIAVQIKPGDTAQAADVAMVIATSSALDVGVNVSPEVAAQLRVDQSVSVTIEGVDLEFAGIVAEIAESDSPNVPVLIHLSADAAEHAAVGMTANVTLAAGASGGGWLVPSTAVQDRNGNQMVFVLRDGRPRPVQVTTGATQDDQIVVQSAELATGDRVVIDTSTMFGGFQRGTGQMPSDGALPPGSQGLPGAQQQTQP